MPTAIQLATLIALLTIGAWNGMLGWASAEIYHGHAVSLRVLQEKVRACQPQQNCDENVTYLAGLKKVDGYVIDSKARDLILIGQVDSTAPKLHLEDLIIALRDAWKMYAIKKGNVYYYADPGCTIDPHPQVIAKLQEIGALMNQLPAPSLEEALTAWHQVCRLPQQVHVLGVPFHSRFARVMVQADYYMKKLADGSEELPISGFSSFSAMYLDAALRDLKAGKAISRPLSLMSRFWFYPKILGYKDAAKTQPIVLINQEDEGIVLLHEFGIMVLTEEEYLDTQGEIVGSGRSAPLAAAWATRFTELYPQIATVRPIYRELENLGRFIALARTIKFKRALAEAQLSLTWLLNRFQITHVTVDETVPGHSNVETIEYRETLANGIVFTTLTLPICGGVEMAITIDHDNFLPDPSGQLALMKRKVLAMRPSARALSWDF